MKIMIWGAGNNGKKIRKYIQQFTDDEFVGFIDSNYNSRCGVISPEKIKDYEFDLLIVSNSYLKDRKEIENFIVKSSIDMDKVTFFVENDVLRNKVLSSTNSYDENNRRVIWLAAFAHYVKSMKLSGNVAECGVDLGEFSYYINKYFPEKKLYLFDTFEGFAEKDILVERELGEEHFLNSRYNTGESFKLTNIDIVKKRMPFIQQCEFCVGWFPDSAQNINDTFCFVNLDTDLYQPILSGLKFFIPRMEEGGIILIHDYFNEELPGVKKAIQDFEDDQGIVLKKFPIADYCSIGVVC